LEEQLPKKNPWINVIRIFVLILVIILSVVLIIYREKIQALKGLGYPGIFLFSILANATVFIPIPGVLFTSAMGAVFQPFWVAIAAGAGAGIGELSGYMAGFSGQAVVENKPRYEKMVGWMRKYGDLTILVLAIIPNPLFDMAGIIAGVMKMPVWKFLLFCIIGKIIKMMAFAYLGSSILGVLQ
jgi:uncharacterized membrane protein YdjX (TVP38/TMEM64 family)